AGHCGVADAVRGKAEPQASGLVQGLSLPSGQLEEGATGGSEGGVPLWGAVPARRDRKSTRLNSSHGSISYAVFCLKKKKTITNLTNARYSKSRTVTGITSLSRLEHGPIALPTSRTGMPSRRNTRDKTESKQTTYKR